jgi:tetratricopeptide (TPR) repeat protein
MMRGSAEQYTIAWFTLAECVSRGERERAFGVYRLLAHSLDDRALVAQLEGDLCCAFKMISQAIDAYLIATRLYRQAGRLLEAASVLEHICNLDQENVQHKHNLAELYGILQLDARVSDLVVDLALFSAARGSYDVILAVIPSIERLHSYGNRAWCYASLLQALHEKEHIPTHILYTLAKEATDAYLRHGDDIALKEYIAKVKTFSGDVYAVVLAALNA